MQKRQIKVTITPEGELKFNNAGNPDEQRILKELASIAELISGDPTGFVVESHVHSHGHGHEHYHEDEHVHVGGEA
jgi:hypothetical protein